MIRVDAFSQPGADPSSAGTLQVGNSFECTQPMAVRHEGRQLVARFVRALFLSGTVGTAAMTAGVLMFPSTEYQVPGSIAHLWAERRRRRRQLSAKEARALALQVMYDTEKGLRREREAEAAFLRMLSDEGP